MHWTRSKMKKWHELLTPPEGQRAKVSAQYVRCESFTGHRTEPNARLALSMGETSTYE